jgi:hypothetical protein
MQGARHWPIAIIKAGFLRDGPALSRRIDRIEEVDGLISRSAIREGAEIEVAFRRWPGGDFKVRIIPLHRDIRIMAIIHQHDVVTGIIGLDQVHLEDEGFFIGVTMMKSKWSTWLTIAWTLPDWGRKKILADPFLQVLGLADIDDLIGSVLHLIDARLIRKQGNEPL